MKHELRRVDPIRAANITALVYGLLMAVFALPMLLMTSFLVPDEDGAAGWLILLLVFYPLMAVVLGWISGWLTCVIYNFVIRWTGGLIVELAGPMRETA